MKKAGMLAVSMCLCVCPACQEDFAVHDVYEVCEGISCSGHGQCIPTSAISAVCLCDEGWHHPKGKQEDKRLMVIGLQTNYCIDATVKSAFERGFDVIVPEGTNSTFDNDYMTGETTVAYYNEDVWDGVAELPTFDEAMEMIEGK